MKLVSLSDFNESKVQESVLRQLTGGVARIAAFYTTVITSCDPPPSMAGGEPDDGGYDEDDGAPIPK